MPYKKRTALSLFSILLASASPMAMAQETQPGDACLVGETGFFRRSRDDNPGPAITGQNFMFCDGTNWLGFIQYDDPTDSVLFRAPAAVPADATFGNSQWSLWLDEASDEFELKGKKSDGTVISATVGGGGGSGLWTDNTTYISFNSAHMIQSGQTLPAVMDDNGTRMFFYPDKAAFRGGAISGGDTAWQDGNIGTGSFAWGLNAEASSTQSVAMGQGNTASGYYSVAMGLNNTASHRASVALGQGNTSSSYYAFTMGQGNTASAYHTIAMGYANTASGTSSVAIGGGARATGQDSIALGGYYTVASGYRSVAMGSQYAYASGSYSIVLGHDVIAGNGVYGSGDGDYSMAIGLGASTGAYPQVTGDNSLGIFMGDQVGVDITTSNLMAVMGGKLIIDPDTTAAANSVPSGTLTVDVEGDIGAVNFCDEDGGNCFAASAVGGGGGLWTAGAGDIIHYNSGSPLVGIGTTTPDTLLHAEADNAAATAVTNVLRLTHTTSGTPNNGIGVGIEFEVETSASNNEVGATIEAVVSDDTSSNEDFELTFNTMDNGTLAERVRIESDGTFGIGTSNPSGLLTVSTDSDDAEVYIDADTDNNNENQNPILTLRQDNGANTGFMRLNGDADDFATDALKDALLIGTGDEAIQFFPNDTHAATFTDTGLFGINMTNPSVELDVTGDIEYTGTIADVSDRRLKTNIQDLSEGQLDKILQLAGVSFRMKDNIEGHLEYGFIAQDVQPIFGSLVYDRSEDGMLSLNYVGLIAPMVEAIKEQNALIEQQATVIEQLEERLKALEDAQSPQ